MPVNVAIVNIAAMMSIHRFSRSMVLLAIIGLISALPARAEESLGELSDVQTWAFNHDGSRVVVCRNDGSLSIWEVAGGKMVAGNLAPKSRAENVLESADGKRFLATFKAGHARVFDSSSGQALSPPLTLRLKTDIDMPLLFSPDGSSLITFTERKATVFNVSSGKSVLTIPLKAGPNETTIGSARFTAGGAQCLVMAGNGNLQRYDTKNWKPIGKPIVHPEADSAYDYFFAVSDDGKWLATYDFPGENGPKGNLQVWDLTAGKPLGQPFVNMNGLKALFVGNNRVLIIPERGTEGKVYDLPSMKVAYTLPVHDDIDGPNAEISPDGKWILDWAYDHRMDLIDAATGQLRGQHTAPSRILKVVMAPDSSGCYVAFEGVAPVKLSFPEMKVTQTLTVTGIEQLPAFSPDGKRFMTSEGEGDKRRLMFFDAATLEPVK